MEVVAHSMGLYNEAYPFRRLGKQGRGCWMSITTCIRIAKVLLRKKSVIPEPGFVLFKLLPSQNGSHRCELFTWFGHMCTLERNKTFTVNFQSTRLHVVSMSRVHAGWLLIKHATCISEYTRPTRQTLLWTVCALSTTRSRILPRRWNPV